MTGGAPAAHLEVWTPAGSRLIALHGGRSTIGNAGASDLVLDDDETVSRLHAVLEPYPTGWCIRDLGSRNGTYVNGERIVGDRALRPGDEILVGRTRLVYRTAPAVSGAPYQTAGVEPPPELTRGERAVLRELCRPVMTGSLLSEPASVDQIAAELVVTASAVKKQLGRLYDKFAVLGRGPRRRALLANEAIRRAAVTRAEIQDDA